jgi:hypothetical protein
VLCWQKRHFANPLGTSGTGEASRALALDGRYAINAVNAVSRDIGRISRLWRNRIEFTRVRPSIWPAHPVRRHVIGALGTSEASGRRRRDKREPKSVA